MSSFQSIRALALGFGGGLVALSGNLTAQTAPQPSTFTVFVRSMPVGNERIAVERTASGWTITGEGRVGPPVDLVIRKFEARYDADCKPIELTVDATFQGQTQTLRTSISGTSATNVLTLNGAPADRTDTVDPTLLLRAVARAGRESDVVVVYVHWGVQGERCVSPDQRSLARRLVRAGADVVVGSHAHVVQGAGRLGRGYVAYGLGNYAWYQPSETGVLTLTVQPGGDGDARVTGATWEPARIGADGLPLPVDGPRRLDETC